MKDFLLDWQQGYANQSHVSIDQVHNFTNLIDYILIIFIYKLAKGYLDIDI